VEWVLCTEQEQMYLGSSEFEGSPRAVPSSQDFFQSFGQASDIRATAMGITRCRSSCAQDYEDPHEIRVGFYLGPILFQDLIDNLS